MDQKYTCTIHDSQDKGSHLIVFQQMNKEDLVFVCILRHTGGPKDCHIK